jgi:tetratricopeptide (TPR) repeat protein
MSRTELVEGVVQQERTRLLNFGVSWGLKRPELVSYLAACVTLQRGCDPEAALSLVNDERREMGFPEDAPAEQIVIQLAGAIPMLDSPGIDAIKPDLVGELLTIIEIREHHLFPSRQRAILDRAWQRDSLSVCHTLIRAATDFSDTDFGPVIADWLRRLLMCETDLEILEQCASTISYSEGASELGIVAAERFIEVVGSRTETDLALLSRVAQALIGIVHRLHSLARIAEAVEPAGRAVALYHKLSVAHPESYRMPLADGLNEYANALKAVGRWQDAYDAAAESVAGMRRLLHEQKCEWTVLAGGLGTLSAILVDLERYETALATEEEALRIFESHNADLDTLDRLNMAIILMNYAHTLIALGREEDALVAADRSMEIRCAMRLNAPDMQRRVELYAGLLSKLELPGSALPAVERALNLYSRLAPMAPLATTAPLVTLVGETVKWLMANGHPDVAVAVGEARVACHRRFAERGPNEFRRDYAAAVDDLAGAIYLAAQNEVQPASVKRALELSQEAARHFQELAEQSPNRYRHEYAITLHNLSLASIEFVGKFDPSRRSRFGVFAGRTGGGGLLRTRHFGTRLSSCGPERRAHRLRSGSHEIDRRSRYRSLLHGIRRCSVGCTRPRCA